MTTSRKVLLLASLALLPAAAAGQQIDPVGAEPEPVRRYALEFILFRYDASVTTGTEIFPPEVPALPDDVVADGTQAVYGDDAFVRGALDGPAETSIDDPNFADTDLDEIITDAARIEMVVLGQEQLTMTAEYERLLSLDAYEPVLWSGWSQVVLEEAVSPPIRLRRLGPLPLEMDGSLTLYLGRFVHLVVDIALEQAATETSGTRYYGDRPRRDRAGNLHGPPRVLYRISEDRIMRNGDTRYFDHPKLGMIARLTLVEETLPEDLESLPADDSAVLRPPGAADNSSL